jgi:hypothetical protein
MSYACRHFTYPAIILWLTFSSIPPSLYNINLKYWNVPFTDTTCPFRLTSPASKMSPLNWDLIYSVLILLNLNSLNSKMCLYNSSLWSTLILPSSISTTSLTKNMYQGISHCMSFVILFITKMKIYKLNTHSWNNFILIENIFDSPSYALMLVIIFVYISLIKGNVLCWNFFSF